MRMASRGTFSSHAANEAVLRTTWPPRLSSYAASVFAVKRARSTSHASTTTTVVSQVAISPLKGRRRPTNAATTSINPGVRAADSLQSRARANSTGTDVSRATRPIPRASRALTHAASAKVVNRVSRAVLAAATQCTGSRCIVNAA